jgi:hypothetical protein
VPGYASHIDSTKTLLEVPILHPEGAIRVGALPATCLCNLQVNMQSGCQVTFSPACFGVFWRSGGGLVLWGSRWVLAVAAAAAAAAAVNCHHEESATRGLLRITLAC